MAGGETSGSAMASIIYFVIKQPKVHRKLNNEVRSAYTSFIDIYNTTGVSNGRAERGHAHFPHGATRHASCFPRCDSGGTLCPKRSRLITHGEISVFEYYYSPNSTSLPGPLHTTSASGTNHTSSSLSAGLIQTAPTSSRLASRSLSGPASAPENCELAPFTHAALSSHPQDTNETALL